MQHAAQVAILHQHRQGMIDGGFDLAHVFAQFRFDIVHAERGIDIGLVLAGNEFQVWLFAPEEAIVVDGHAHTERAPAQRDVVLFGAGEVMEGIRELAIVDDTQVHIYAAAQHYTGFCLALAGDSLDGRLAGKHFHDLALDLVACGVANTHYHIDITYRLTAAAQAAPYLHAHNLRYGCQHGLNTCGLFLRYRVEKTPGVLFQEGKALENVILGLLAKAGQCRHLILFNGFD